MRVEHEVMLAWQKRSEVHVCTSGPAGARTVCNAGEAGIDVFTSLVPPRCRYTGTYWTDEIYGLRLTVSALFISFYTAWLFGHPVHLDTWCYPLTVLLHIPFSRVVQVNSQVFHPHSQSHGTGGSHRTGQAGQAGQVGQTGNNSPSIFIHRVYMYMYIHSKIWKF
jgi:hypothetical protein